MTWPTDQVTGQPEKIKKIIEILIAQVEKLINNSYRFDFKCENRWYIYIKRLENISLENRHVYSYSTSKN